MKRTGKILTLERHIDRGTYRGGAHLKKLTDWNYFQTTSWNGNEKLRALYLVEDNQDGIQIHGLWRRKWS